MASDTCISFGTHKEPFGGIKVLSVPVEIRGPTDLATQKSDILYQKVAGMCFEGGFLGAYLVKEVISEVLSHLQTIDAIENITFERIAQVVLRYYGNVWSRLKKSPDIRGHNANFILGGYCPKERAIRVFRFSLTSKDEPQLEEVLRDFPLSYATQGSGARRFSELLDADLAAGGVRIHFQVPGRIRDVIREKSISSVDGTVQYGEFDHAGDFKLYGIVDPDDRGPMPTRRLFVRGTDIEEAEQGTDAFGLHVHYSFKDPFR